ncbi:MAG: thioredoxin family protein [Hyphomicrobiaceae bacterium]
MQRLIRSLVSLLAVASTPAAADPALRLFVFEIDGCTACDQFHAEALRDYWSSPVSQRLPLTLVDLNALGTAGQALRSPIRVVPTFVVMRDGIEIARLSGFPGKSAFEAGIASVLADEQPTASLTPLP